MVGAIARFAVRDPGNRWSALFDRVPHSEASSNGRLIARQLPTVGCPFDHSGCAQLLESVDDVALSAAKAVAQVDRRKGAGSAIELAPDLGEKGVRFRRCLSCPELSENLIRLTRP